MRKCPEQGYDRDVLIEKGEVFRAEQFELLACRLNVVDRLDQGINARLLGFDLFFLC